MTEDWRSRIPAEHHAIVADWPVALRDLLTNELAAGNRIVEVGHTHPAPPVGAWIMLADRVTTQPRKSTPALRFYERDSSQYLGEFTDERGFCYLLEAPGPPPEPPDMDAIREALGRTAAPPRTNGTPSASVSASAALERFRASMHIDYAQWREGIGYDLAALAELTDHEQTVAMASLVPPTGWRDVDALLVVRHPGAVEALRHAAHSGALEVRLAIADRAPHLMSDAQRTAALLQAITSADIMDGLSRALDQCETFHPPAVHDALWQALLDRDGGAAYHCAATLAVIHGAIPSRFDWTHRPLFLRFNTPDRAERLAARQELRVLLGVPPDNAGP